METAIVGAIPPLRSDTVSKPFAMAIFTSILTYLIISKMVGRSSPVFCHIFLARPEKDRLSLLVADLACVSRRDNGGLSEFSESRELVREAIAGMRLLNSKSTIKTHADPSSTT